MRELTPTPMMVCLVAEGGTATPMAVKTLLQPTAYLIGEADAPGSDRQMLVVARSQVKATFESKVSPASIAAWCPPANLPSPCTGTSCPPRDKVAVERLGDVLQRQADAVAGDIATVRSDVARIAAKIDQCGGGGGRCESGLAKDATLAEVARKIDPLVKDATLAAVGPKIDVLAKDTTLTDVATKIDSVAAAIKGLAPAGYLVLGTVLPEPRDGLGREFACDQSRVEPALAAAADALPAVRFDLGSAQIVPRDPDLRRHNPIALDAMERFVRDTRDKHGDRFYFLLLGEADSTGGPTRNFTLSQQRVDSVRDALVAKLRGRASTQADEAQLRSQFRLVPAGEGRRYRDEDPDDVGKRRVRLYVCRANPRN